MSASERRIEDLKRENARLKHLLSETMRTGEALEVSAIVNLEGVPRVDLRWENLATQMGTSDARMLALQIIECAGWADQDALSFTTLREMFDERTAAGFMAMMREARGGREDRAAG